jgi:hypothetical protein
MDNILILFIIKMAQQLLNLHQESSHNSKLQEGISR